MGMQKGRDGESTSNRIRVIIGHEVDYSRSSHIYERHEYQDFLLNRVVVEGIEQER